MFGAHLVDILDELLRDGGGSSCPALRSILDSGKESDKVNAGMLQIFGTQISLLLEKTKTPLLSPVRVGAAVFLDHTRADSDHSKILSVPESIVLAIPVSIDSLIGGL